MSASTNGGFLDWLTSLFRPKAHPEHPDNLEHSGDRDGALTMSEEPTAEEIIRVTTDKSSRS